MANIFDYLSWRGDLTFEQSPLNPVDNIIFSQLAYLPLDGIVPGLEENGGITAARAAAIFAEKMERNTLAGMVVFKSDPAFIIALGKTNRYKNCTLHSYVNHMDIVQEKQFSALCIDMGAETFVSYRGTDANIVGWKEDFNMSFNTVVPAQLEAVSYLKKAAEKVKGNLLPGGHSKGGNLAIYASANCGDAIQDRIPVIYSNDAPGFHRLFIESDGFRRIRQRVRLFVPQTSIVGMLFEHGSDYIVIRSSQTGILQHELYTWEVTYNDMIRLPQLTHEGRFIKKTLREWLNSLDAEHLQQFAETLFGILDDANIKSFSEQNTDWLKAVFRMIQSMGNIDRTTRRNIRKMLAELFNAAKNNIDTLIPQDAPFVQKRRWRLFALTNR